MGNAQPANTSADNVTAQSAAGGGKSRRGSRVKVFSRFSQKKQQQPRAAEFVASTPTSVLEDSIDEELLRQSHASVIRQLESEQSDFRNPKKFKFKKILKKQNFEVNEDAAQRVTVNEPTSRTKQKCSATSTIQLKPESKELKDLLRANFASKNKEFMSSEKHEPVPISAKDNVKESELKCEQNHAEDRSELVETLPASAETSTLKSDDHIQGADHISPLEFSETSAARNFTFRGLNEIPVLAKDRPLSEVSITSADTSGILSPTTAKVINELHKRHRADKLSQLSVTQTTYFELQPEIVTDTSPEVDNGSPDEQMALHLGKKLAQVLSNNNSTADDDVEALPVNSCLSPSPVTGSNDVFTNIAKTKKVELQNLSSRLTTAHITPPSEKVEKSSSDDKVTGSETQSTVIISFKSSQTSTPQSAQLSTVGTSENDLTALVTPAALTESLGTNGTTIANQLGSLTNNVLKKVATFTVENTAVGVTSGLNGNSNVVPSALHSENGGMRRPSFVPEKLSFSSYEKFEGQMLVKWLTSSLQNNGINLSEQELNNLTMQYCSNLINIGVLKKIDGDADNKTFSPFQMYQWTYTELPTISTPGKLDAITAWPHCSTPTGQTRETKGIQAGSVADISFLPSLKKRLLACANIEEVKAIANDLSIGSHRVSKRYFSLLDFLNASEDTIYQYENEYTAKGPITASKPQFQNVSVQTDTPVEKDIVNQAVDQSVQTLDENITVVAPTQLPAPPPPPPPPPPCYLSISSSIPISPPLPPAPPAPPQPPPKPMQPAPPPPPAPPAPPPPPNSGPNAAPPPPAPPAPPPPAMPSVCSSNSSLMSQPPPPPPSPAQSNTNIPPPPPPASHKQPTPTTPAPLPSPAASVWFQQGSNFRKTAINPPKPMKPLYWTRIITNAPPPIQNVALPGSTDSSCSSPEDQVDISTPKEIWQQIGETNLDNIDEFTELFSRQVIVPISLPKETKEVRVKTMKVLDSKRSQNVGIVSRSLHVDFCEIEHAIYHVDTSVVSLETLQQIINIKASNEELELIKEAAKSNIPLDHPETFLLKISEISMSTERISCIIFQAEFEEAATVITRKLQVVLQLSQYLIASEDLKLIFSIILTLGNYMNGGNRQRGQADGFTLEILGKLKDVKSKESQTTLLHFIVRTYINQKRKEGVQVIELSLPIPEPADVERASQVDFDEVNLQINELNKKLSACMKTTERVLIASTEDTMEPFKTKMEEFFEIATKSIEKLYKDLEESRELFVDTMRFYHFTPKSRTLEQCTPDQFFEYWTNFTNDFKDIWRKEIAVLRNDLLRKSKQLQTETRKTVKTTKAKPGGLKERIIRLSKK